MHHRNQCGMNFFILAVHTYIDDFYSPIKKVSNFWFGWNWSAMKNWWNTKIHHSFVFMFEFILSQILLFWEESIISQIKYFCIFMYITWQMKPKIGIDFFQNNRWSFENRLNVKPNVQTSLELFFIFRKNKIVLSGAWTTPDFLN